MPGTQLDSGGAGPRIAVIIPCYNDGELVGQAVNSIRESEPVEVVIVDDGSDDPGTRATLARLEGEGWRVVRHEHNRGTSEARMTGIAATTAPYFYPLDADDFAVRGAYGRMADLLDANPDAGACLADYIEFSVESLLRAVPESLDPYRVAFTNEYPPTAVFRRDVLDAVGGWKRLSDAIDSRADWGLWMSLAEAGVQGVHMGPGQLTYLRRMHPNRLAARGNPHARELYKLLRKRHSDLFGRIADYRRESAMTPTRRRLYPMIYGRRARLRGERYWKQVLDRRGVWTLTREYTHDTRAQAAAAFEAAQRSSLAPPSDGARVAVVVPCFNDGQWVGQAVRSIREDEPIEVIIVDDGSTDEHTHRILDELESDGFRVLRLGQNQGVSAARNEGLKATSASFVLPLDADDLVVPGGIAQLADRLESEPHAGVCFGDYLEFSVKSLVRAVPEALDPFRLTYINEYPATQLYRRSTVTAAGGWTARDTYEDWDLWMTFVEKGIRTVHLGEGIGFWRRLHGVRLGAAIRQHHPEAYARLRERHPKLFAEVAQNRRRSSMTETRKALYPFVYGGRRRRRGEQTVKRVLDRFGIWTMQR